VGDQVAGVDPLVDEVNRAPDFLGFAVVERPERAIGATVFRGKAAMQIDEPESAHAQQWSLDE